MTTSAVEAEHNLNYRALQSYRYCFFANRSCLFSVNHLQHELIAFESHALINS